MRRPTIRIAAAAAIAVALFAAAAVGGVVRSGSSRDGGPRAVPPSDAILRAVGGASLDATIASLEARVDAVPGDWRAAASLGAAYVQQARIGADPTVYAAAEAALERSLALAPRGNGDALVGLASLEAARHRFDRSLRLARRAVRVNPYDADAYAVAGDALVELGRYGAAGRAIQRSVDLRPGLASFARVSYLLELRGDVDGAIRAMRLAHRLAASRVDAAWAAAHVGALHLGAGRVGAARAWYRRAVGADPASREAAAGLAWIRWARGDLAGAIAAYERLVAEVPTPAEVATLADLHAAAGDAGAARALSATARAQARLARAAGALPGIELALFEADRGVAGSASSARGGGRGARGRGGGGGGAAGGAALRAARAEWSRRRSVHVADAMAWALYANGRYRRAAGFSDLALRLGTRSALFHFHAGMIRLRLGERLAALRLLREARAIDPRFSVRWTPVLEGVLARLEAWSPAGPGR